MKIVHIEEFFHPNTGYQVNLLSKYMVKQGHAITIITAEMDKMPEHLTSFFGNTNIEEDDKRYTEATGVIIIRLPIRAYISGRAIFGRILEKTISELEPDILYIHGNDSFTCMRYIRRKNELKSPIITDSHMLEMASTNRFNKIFRKIYRNFITPIIIKNNITVIRTQDDPYVEKCLGIPLKLAPWISVGSDTMLFHPDENVKENFRTQLKISKEDFLVLYAGKLDESKGGQLLANVCKKKMTNNKDKNVVFIIVGNTVGEYGKQIEAMLDESENRIIRFVTQKYMDLAKFYQVADLCVFPCQCSLSFYDAQACGLPVISEDNNINIDRLKFNNGLTFKSEDKEDFREKILQFINLDKDVQEEMKTNSYYYIKDNYDYEKIARDYMDIIKVVYKRDSRKLIK